MKADDKEEDSKRRFHNARFNEASNERFPDKTLVGKDQWPHVTSFSGGSL